MDLPLRLDITILQRATFRERLQLPLDCTDREVEAQVWRVRNGRRYEATPAMTFTVDWIDRAAAITVEGETVTYGDFYLVGDWQDTTELDGVCQWDLLVIEGPSLARAGEVVQVASKWGHK